MSLLLTPLLSLSPVQRRLACQLVFAAQESENAKTEVRSYVTQVGLGCGSWRCETDLDPGP